MLKKEMTQEFKNYVQFLEELIESFLKENKYPYKYHFIMHSFQDEFILKLMLLPKHRRKDIKMTQVSYITFYKNMDNVELNNVLLSSRKRIQKDELYSYTEADIKKTITEYHHRIHFKNQL